MHADLLLIEFCLSLVLAVAVRSCEISYELGSLWLQASHLIETAKEHVCKDVIFEKSTFSVSERIPLGKDLSRPRLYLQFPMI